ncbi:hypothetical protein OK142_22530 [Agrobacterium sp. BT-220-3]|nr:hypothetical protein [Agrobacterium sp. BT-220-3]
MAATKTHKTKHTAAPGSFRLSHRRYEESLVSAETTPAKKILVFLSRPAADVIVTKLAERGYASDAVSTVPEAFDALRSDGYSVAITTRPEIDILRTIRSIPVVNLEIFFHSVPSGERRPLTSRRFDGRAFMERIDFLVQAASTKGDHLPVEAVKPPDTTSHALWRWWTRAKRLLGLPRHSEGLGDARS